jgi:hypothetical protein
MGVHTATQRKHCDWFICGIVIAERELGGRGVAAPR